MQEDAGNDAAARQCWACLGPKVALALVVVVPTLVLLVLVLLLA